MKFYNRVKFRTSTSGTGTLTAGSAVTGFRTPAQASIPDGTLLRYVIDDDNGGWETGYGTYTVSGTTLSRNVMQSSNSDALITLSGNATVRITPLAEDFLGNGVLIEERSPSGTGTVSLTSILPIYRSLRLGILGRSTKAATNFEDAVIEFNGDATAANYRRQFAAVYGAGSSFFEGADNNTIMVRMPATTSPSGSPGAYSFEIPYYANTTFNKIIYGSGAARIDNTSLQLEGINLFMEWENTAAINRIDLILPSGNWVAGTKISLIGIN